MSTSPTLAFICSAGCPEIVAGLWIIGFGAVAFLIGLARVVVRVAASLAERPHWIPFGNRLETFGGIGFGIAVVAFWLLIAAALWIFS